MIGIRQLTSGAASSRATGGIRHNKRTTYLARSSTSVSMSGTVYRIPSPKQDFAITNETYPSNVPRLPLSTSPSRPTTLLRTKSQDSPLPLPADTILFPTYSEFELELLRAQAELECANMTVKFHSEMEIKRLQSELESVKSRLEMESARIQTEMESVKAQSEKDSARILLNLEYVEELLEIEAARVRSAESEA